MGKKLTLTSSDNKEFSVSRDVISEFSVTIKNMLEDFEESDESISLPLSNVSGETLDKIIKYCEHHHEEKRPKAISDEDTYRTDNILPWDKEFMEVPMKLLFDIILAANFLDIKPLLDLGCKIVAINIKGKDLEQLKKTFAIPK